MQCSVCMNEAAVMHNATASTSHVQDKGKTAIIVMMNCTSQINVQSPIVKISTFTITIILKIIEFTDKSGNIDTYTRFAKSIIEKD